MGKWIIIISIAILAIVVGCTTDPEMATFTITVEVLPGSTTPIAPLAWAVHSGDNPLYTPDTMDRINGLEALAEDGDPSTVATSLMSLSDVVMSGSASIPVGMGSPAPAGPGESYSFNFSATEGEMLAFATMFVQSNDLFYGPASSSIDLFPGGNPISGDITGQINLYDAGTEVNEEPGIGPNQAPRQTGPNTGPDENGSVLLISDVSDGFTYPAVADVIKVTVAAMQ